MAGKNNDTNMPMVHCSFCGKTEKQVHKLIAGPNGVYICDECIDLCDEILAEEFQDDFDTPEEETEINYLTEHELGLIINNECPIPVLRKAIIFACITGFRRSDILALKWEDIKELPKGGWCVFKRMQKTKNMANVPIGDDLMEVIGPRGEGLVFNGLTTYMLTYPMKRWFKSIGIKKDLHFHCLRHGAASAGFPVRGYPPRPRTACRLPLHGNILFWYCPHR